MANPFPAEFPAPFPAWLPAAVTCFGLVASVTAYQWLTERDTLRVQRNADLAVAELQRELAYRIDSRLDAFDRLARRAGVAGGASRHWQGDATDHLRVHPSIAALALLDAEGRARDIVTPPWAPAAKAVWRRLETASRSLASPRPQAAFLQHEREAGNPEITLLLGSQASAATPGVAALVDPRRLFADILREDLAHGSRIAVRVAGQAVFLREASGERVKGSSRRFPLAHRGIELDVEVTQARGPLHAPEQIARNGFLIAGLVATAMIALLLLDYSRLHVLRSRGRALRDELGLLNATLEERVARRTQSLADANRELEGYAYSIAHDMRSPLRQIQGFGEELEHRLAGRLDGEEARMLARLIARARHQGQLVDELLRYARIGAEEVRPEAVALGPLVAELVEQVGIARAGAISWRIAALPGVHAEPALLRVALQNVLENAVKFSAAQPAPVIEVFAEARGNGATAISVRDNGVGFRPEQAHRLFGIFERLHDEREYPGTGIGLASVRRIIQRLGGTVEAEGAPGKGAQFTLVFPGAPKQ